MSDKYTPQDLQDNLDYLSATKALIKQAIIDKEQLISDDDTFRSYADKIRAIETGIKTDDATATANDILAPKTAYVNDTKITGTIIPAYDASLPEQYNRQISYSVTLNDADLDYNIGVYCSATSLCRVYRLNDTSIASSYTSASTSNYSTTITYYTNTATLSHVPTVIDGVTYLRCYVAAKNSSNYVGIASFLINVETLACSNYVWKQVSSMSWNGGTTSNNPYILNVPTTTNKCLIAYFAISSADAWTHYQMITFSTTSGTTKAITYSGNNTSNTAQGLTDFRWNFSPDGKTLGCFSNMTRMWGNPHYWTTIIRFSDDYNSFDVLKNTVDNTKPLSKYSLLINDELFANGTSVYDIDNINTKVFSLPFTPEATCNGMQLGKYYYYVSSTSATTIAIYEVGDTSLSKVTDVSIKANQVFYHPGKDIVFVSGNNNITGYKLGELGTLIGIKRLDVEYFNTQDADATSDHILSGKKAYVSSGKTIGTMPNNGTLNYYIYETDKTIPAGYTLGGTIYAPEFSNFSEYSQCLSITNNILS